MISDSPLFQDVISIYNRYATELPNPPFPPVTTIRWDKTVIRGVSWKDDIQVNPNNNGISTPSKTISITIPIEADQSGKTYIKPQEFANLPLDNFDHWTLRPGATDPDIIVLGEGPELTALYTVNQLMRDYKHTSPIQVSDSSEQDVLPGWRIVGV